MVDFFRMLGRRARGLVREKAEGEAPSKDIEVAEPPEPVDLNPIAIAIHHGCMGLPQEIVDYIMDMLHDNIQALKACSLTCRAMFASTRHLVHQTLHLTTENIASRLLLDKEEKSRYRMRDFLAANLQFLSQMGERGLLQYTRQVHINLYCTLTPEILQPQLHYFQSLDRVHALTLAHTDTSQYHHQECFTHFYPTLTSLTLRFPLGDYRDILRFASQFPKLENLCLDSNGIRSGLNSTTAVITDRYPPLCGRLRLVGNHTVAQWPVDFVNELPNGMNFRSIELVDLYQHNPQHLLNTCTHTLENLSIVFRGNKHTDLEDLVFTEFTVLRRFTIRLRFLNLHGFNRRALFAALSTITSPVFCELELEICVLPSRFTKPSWVYWSGWEEVAEFLEELFGAREDFKLIVTTGKLHDRETFHRHVKEIFPSWADRGRIHFKISDSIYRY